MERIAFVLGITLMAFVWGVATAEFEIFPFKLMKEAKLGLEALAAMDRHNSRYPNAFEKFEDGATPQPHAKTLENEAGKELVLVTGGPYQMMDRCPTWGCMAWITDRSGKVLHSWEVNLDALWKDLSGIAGDVNRLSLYPVGMALGKDGSLVVSFQGRETYPVHIGIAKFDRNGAIAWKRFDRSHHWMATDDAGNIYTPASTTARNKYVGGTWVDVPCKSGEATVDFVRVLSPEGKPLREVPIVDSFLRAGRKGLFYNLRDACNPTHLNSINLVTEALAGKIPGAQTGDMLVSLRETNMVALLDGKTGEVRYSQTDLTAAQHSPEFLPDGTVLAFDNLGGERSQGGSRVVRIDLVKGTAETVFPRDNAKALLPVQSKTAGDIEVSPDGQRALVSITHQGRIIEIDVASGKPLWTYENTHDIGKFLDENGLSTKKSRARFATYGAYYVSNVEFLK